MYESAFYHAALAVMLGMAGQVVASWLGAPTIIVLLAVGVAAGPDGLGLLDPGALGPAVAHIVRLAVTVILFEGGLALRLDEVRRQQRPLALLLSLGAAISMLSGTVAAHLLLGMTWSIACLYGALVIVSGPTVVTPLLGRLTLDRTVRELLISEGVLIDPIGATAAIVAAEYVVGHSVMWQAGWLLILRLGVGALVGAAAGAALTVALRRGWIAEHLRNPVVLGVLLFASALASGISSEAGLMAAVVQGAVMANAGLRSLGPLRQFKEELTVLLLSLIFVLLAAGLSLDAVRALGWRSLAVVALLAWGARPLAVLLCTRGSTMSLRQRLFVSWICPRGIVAAAVAGLFGILLRDAGIPGGEQLEALVFVTVACTVTVQGLTAGIVARLLGVDQPSLQGTLIVGADRLGRVLARALLAEGRTAVVLDRRVQHCRAAQAEGLPVFLGDALDVDFLEEAGVRYADTVVAATRNPELNTLIGQRIRGNFRVERLLILGDAEAQAQTPESRPFPGDFPGADEVNRQLRMGRAWLVEYEAPSGEGPAGVLKELPYGKGEFALLLRRRENIYVVSSEMPLQPEDRLLCLQTTDRSDSLASVLRTVRRYDPGEPKELPKPAARP